MPNLCSLHNWNRQSLSPLALGLFSAPLQHFGLGTSLVTSGDPIRDAPAPNIPNQSNGASFAEVLGEEILAEVPKTNNEP